MTKELTDAQRRLLFDLVIRDQRPSQSKTGLKTKDRDALVDAGYIVKVKAPKGRALLVEPTEKAWGFVVDQFDLPFTTNVTLRHLWGALTAKLKSYLDGTGENLASVLNYDARSTGEEPSSEPERVPPVERGASAAEQLRAAYLRLSEGEMKRRVRISALRAEAGLPRGEVDAALQELHDEEAVVLYPDDEGYALDAGEHAAALDLSGTPRHIIYWEK